MILPAKKKERDAMPHLPQEIWARRLESEYFEMLSSGISFQASSDKTRYVVSLNAPAFEKTFDGTVKQRREHEFKILLSRDYPYAGSVEVWWLTPIFHPNISKEGVVCIQLLNLWNEGTTVKSVVQGIKQLLENPNPADPLDKEAAKYFQENSLVRQASGKKRPRVVP